MLDDQDRRNQIVTTAQAIAKFLLYWHRHYGVAAIRSRYSYHTNTYLMALEELESLDLTVAYAALQVAKAQISGPLEAFYTEAVPPGLWHEFVGHSFDLPRPANLGAAAILIRDLIKNAQSEQASGYSFTLPGNWEHVPGELGPNTSTVALRPDESLTGMLDRYFATLGSRESLGVGGRDLMIAMNEDALAQEIFEDSVTVYNPTAFYFELSTGEGNLTTLVLDGTIRIEEVIVGCSPDYAGQEQREDHEQ